MPYGVLPGFRSASQAEPPESLLDTQGSLEAHGLGSFPEPSGCEQTAIPCLLDRTVELVAVRPGGSDIDQ